jgi:hypothetical protein
MTITTTTTTTTPTMAEMQQVPNLFDESETEARIAEVEELRERDRALQEVCMGTEIHSHTNN